MDRSLRRYATLSLTDSRRARSYQNRHAAAIVQPADLFSVDQGLFMTRVFA
jgi:hypothetical protein